MGAGSGDHDWHLAMHILVRVVTLAAADFGVSRGTIQLAVTLYLFGAAGGQLMYGPVSDGFGRRPTLLAALCLYVAASAVAGWAAGLATLLAAWVVQAVGGCGGLVLGRAIVRDSAAAGQAASRMALLTMVQSLAPGIGPAVGGFLGAALFFLAAVTGMLKCRDEARADDPLFDQHRRRLAGRHYRCHQR